MGWHKSTKVKFWDDVWCGDERLKNSFPELYRIACEKDAYVADHIHIRDESVHWEVNFTRLAHDWELESISTFWESIYSAFVKGFGEDKICWKPAQKGFHVQSYYSALSPFGADFFFLREASGRLKSPLELHSSPRQLRWGEF